MNESTKLIAVLAAAALGGIYLLQGRLPQPVPPPAPAPHAGLDLLPVFSAGDPARARIDAARSAAMFAELARVLEFDGRQQPAPRFKDDGQVQDLRRQAVTYWTGEAGLASRYGGFSETVGRHLEQQLGSDARELTSDRRRTWCAAFTALGEACQAAAERL